MTQTEYDQQKRECWEEFCRHIVDEEEAFYNMFDRAYALGKLQASCGQVKEAISQDEIEKASVEYADKTAEQYEVCNSEFVQEIMVAFEQGANFALGKQEKDADTVIQGWVARDKDGALQLWESKPQRNNITWDEWGMAKGLMLLPDELFPDLTWESDPEPVEIIIKRKKK